MSPVSFPFFKILFSLHLRICRGPEIRVETPVFTSSNFQGTQKKHESLSVKSSIIPSATVTKRTTRNTATTVNSKLRNVSWPRHNSDSIVVCHMMTMNSCMRKTTTSTKENNLHHSRLEKVSSNSIGEATKKRRRTHACSSTRNKRKGESWWIQEQQQRRKHR